MTNAANLSKTGSLVNSSGQISLTTGVTGILPVANGGTGSSTGVAPGGSSTNVQYNSSGTFAGSSSFVFDGTNVGIGTASPAQTLHVKTSTASTPITLGALSNATSIPALSFNGAYASTTMAGTYQTGTNLYNTVPATGYHYWSVADVNKMTLDTNGNLGIGTASPGELIASKLDVNAGDTTGANIAVFRTGNATAANNAGGGFYAGASATATSRYVQMWLDADGANFGGGDYFFINKAGNSGNVTYSLSPAAAHIWKSNAGTERMRIDSSGNLQLSTAGTSILNSSGRKMLNQTGGILQVVQTVLTTCLSTTSTTYIDTGLTVAITPSSTSSKILIQVCLNDISKSDNGLVGFNLTRNGTTVVYNTTTGTGSTYQAWNTFGGFGQNRVCAAASLNYLDSPASASSITYKVQMKVEGGTGYLNQWGLNTDASAVSTITVMEIAG